MLPGMRNLRFAVTFLIVALPAAAEDARSGWDRLADPFLGVKPGTAIRIRTTESSGGAAPETSEATWKYLKSESGIACCEILPADEDEPMQGGVSFLDPDFASPDITEKEIRKETIKVGGKNFDCRVYERRTASVPEDQRKGKSHAVSIETIWKTTGTKENGGILKVTGSKARIGADGTVEEVGGWAVEVTELGAKAAIGKQALACTVVKTTESKPDGTVTTTRTEWRSPLVPGGWIRRKESRPADKQTGMLALELDMTIVEVIPAK